jgi:hypothetical protein
VIRFGPLTLARRPALFGLAFLTAFVGGFAMVRAAEKVWAADIHRNLDAAQALLDGAFGTTPDYLYSPLAAALTVPALALPTDIAVLGWLVIKVVILVVGIAVATRGFDRADRVLMAVAVVGFLPLLYDLELGNVTVLMLGALACVAWAPDRVVTGIPLGLILATAPKPQLLPVLIWMLLVHRRALAGVVVTAALATLVGVLLAGLDAYSTWLAILRAPSYLTAGNVINLAVWSFPTPLAVVAAVATVIGLVVGLSRGYWPGLVASLCAGMLLAPYTLVYAAGLLPVVAPAAARASPRLTLALALIAPVVLVLAFQLWVGVVLVAVAWLPTSAWPSAAIAVDPGGRVRRSGSRPGLRPSAPDAAVDEGDPDEVPGHP